MVCSTILIFCGLNLIFLVFGVVRWYPFAKEAKGNDDYEQYRLRIWNIYKKSFLFWAFERIFCGIQFFSPFNIIHLNPHISSVRYLYLEKDKKNNYGDRTSFVDVYLIISWIIGFLVFVSYKNYYCGNGSDLLKSILVTIVLIRIIEIIQTSCNQVLFNVYRFRDEWKTAYHSRNLIFSIANYLEITWLFAILYMISGELTNNSNEIVTNNWDVWYFSTVTQFTVGYGDITPVGIARLIVIFHLAVSLIMAALIIARFASSAPKYKDEMQMEIKIEKEKKKEEEKKNGQK